MKKIVLSIANLLGLKNTLVDFVINRRSKKLYGLFIKNGELVFDVGDKIGNRVKFFNELGAK